MRGTWSKLLLLWFANVSGKTMSSTENSPGSHCWWLCLDMLQGQVGWRRSKGKWDGGSSCQQSLVHCPVHCHAQLCSCDGSCSPNHWLVTSQRILAPRVGDLISTTKSNCCMVHCIRCSGCVMLLRMLRCVAKQHGTVRNYYEFGSKKK